jgi:hypothetical protein
LNCIRKILPPLLIISSIAAYFVYDQLKVKSFFRDLYSEYPSASAGREYYGTITKIYSLPTWIRSDPHYTYLILNDTLKVSFHAETEIKTKAPLKEVVKIGDQVEFAKGEGFLIITRQSGQDSLVFKFHVIYE